MFDFWLLLFAAGLLLHQPVNSCLKLTEPSQITSVGLDRINDLFGKRLEQVETVVNRYIEGSIAQTDAELQELLEDVRENFRKMDQERRQLIEIRNDHVCIEKFKRDKAKVIEGIQTLLTKSEDICKRIQKPRIAALLERDPELKNIKNNVIKLIEYVTGIRTIVFSEAVDDLDSMRNDC